MERRQHTRHRTLVKVYLTAPGRKGRACAARNLSATGVFIESADLNLEKGQQVDLTFTVRLGAITKIHRRVGVVARITNDGTGLRMRGLPRR
jgi:hypothetical protein